MPDSDASPAMRKTNALVPSAIASFIGLLLFAVTALLTDKREPWDASEYWTVAYPSALLACAILGYACPDRPWRWAIILFEAQFLAMCVRNGELGNLWPMGMLLFAIVALPGVLAAKLAVRFFDRTA